MLLKGTCEFIPINFIRVRTVIVQNKFFKLISKCVLLLNNPSKTAEGGNIFLNLKLYIMKHMLSHHTRVVAMSLLSFEADADTTARGRG